MPTVSTVSTVLGSVMTEKKASSTSVAVDQCMRAVSVWLGFGLMDAPL